MKIVTIAASTKEFTRKSEGDVIELRDGRLLHLYMEFSGDGSDVAKTRIVAQESADRGATWGKHRVVTVTDPGDLNVFSPNLIRSRDGAILLLFMRQHALEHNEVTQHLWRSDDEGATFKAVRTFAERRPLSLCNAVVKRLASGRLLLPVMDTERLGPSPYALRGSVAILYSDDDGVTWTENTQRLSLPMRGAMEPHVEETRDGRALVVMRNQLGSLFMSESRDGGVTWSLPQTTGLRVPESCPEMTKIPSTGDLLMIWNNSEYNPGISHFGKRTPLTAAVSRDEGRTWQHVRDIETDPKRAFSNPGCRFTRDGLAIVTYWTCELLPDWGMQDVIDQRVAVIETPWFYGK